MDFCLHISKQFDFSFATLS